MKMAKMAKMAKISFLITFLTHFLCILGQIQLSHNPCFGYFTYVAKPGITDILGQIEITPPTKNDAFYLKVALNTATELSSQVIRLELAQSIKESVLRAHQGRPLLYHVYYPMNEQIPSLSAIWFNSQRYCPGPEVSGNITANVELGHILFPPNKEPIVYSFGQLQQISRPYRNLSTYRIDYPSYDRLNLNYSTSMAVFSSDETANNECGNTSYYTDETNRLIPDGDITSPGQWPWLVAIYQQDDEKYSFKCTGSILTVRHVVTYNGCVEMSLMNYTSPGLKRLWVLFGQLNSLEWDGNHTGIISRMVANYTKSTNQSDYPYFGLAILLLSTAVEFNAFIMPICLWSGSTNLQDTVNLMGYIVGWNFSFMAKLGGDILKRNPVEQRMTKVPLINLSVHPYKEYALLYYTHPEYFCYTSVGGGLMVFNITTGRYQLRAVMSHCPFANGTFEYFDVAKEISWIQQQILLT